MKSEFGKGLAYNIGLFLAHQMQFKEEIMDKPSIYVGLWFNGASDHLYELEIPDNLPISLKKRLKKFQNKVLDWGHGSGLMNKNKLTQKDIEWSLNEDKNLLLNIDKFFGISVKKGENE